MIKEITKEILSNNKTYLEQIEAREVFDEIYQGLSNVVSTTAFIVALDKIIKTEETMQAIIEASKDAIVKPSFSFQNTFQTINLEQNQNYLDVYFAVDIINSANKIKAIKYATKNTNNNYIFQNYSTDKILYSQEFYNDIEESNFCYYYLDNSEKYIKYTEEIRKNLDFKNIFDCVDNFLNPFNVKNTMIGTSSKDDIEKLAKLGLLLKYDNTLVISSEKGIPYAVLDGENIIAEAWKNKIFTYTMNSKLVDLPDFPIEEIKVKDSKHSLSIIEEVFKNKTKNASYYTIILNSGLALYISKHTSSLMDGIKLAQETIETGFAFEKLQQFKQNKIKQKDEI